MLDVDSETSGSESSESTVVSKIGNASGPNSQPTILVAPDGTRTWHPSRLAAGTFLQRRAFPEYGAETTKKLISKVMANGRMERLRGYVALNGRRDGSTIEAEPQSETQADGKRFVYTVPIVLIPPHGKARYRFETLTSAADAHRVLTNDLDTLTTTVINFMRKARDKKEPLESGFRVEEPREGTNDLPGSTRVQRERALRAQAKAGVSTSAHGTLVHLVRAPARASVPAPASFPHVPSRQHAPSPRATHSHSHAATSATLIGHKRKSGDEGKEKERGKERERSRHTRVHAPQSAPAPSGSSPARSAMSPVDLISRDGARQHFPSVRDAAVQLALNPMSSLYVVPLAQVIMRLLTEGEIEGCNIVFTA